MSNKTILYKKKYLIYGFGKSGFASYKFLKQKNNCKIFDDNKKNVPLKFRSKTIDYKQLKSNFFDHIVISPGIDINKCKLSKYLKKNRSKVITDLDIFYLNYPKIKKISVTGTNGKSTTSKLLYEVLKDHKKDVRLTGNIGNPVLLEKRIKNNTLFIIETSSYQLEYSKFYKSEYSIILNLFPDHLERHGSFVNYIKAKFKLLKKQSKNNYGFIESNNKTLNYLVKKNKVKSKVVKVNYNKYQKHYKLISNYYFKNKSNIKNLSFIFSLAKYLNLKTKKIIKVTNKFKGLEFRQQIVYDSKKLTVINDSKSTSLSSTKPLLESYKNIYWILGGLAKKGDKLNLDKKYYKKIKAFIFGKDKIFFSKIFSKKIKYKISKNLKDSFKLVLKDLNHDNDKKKIILFSPSAASFDQFKNFEERGKYFNKIFKNCFKSEVIK